MNNKTGRNEPCPCGSGKKYKKCCIIEQQSNALVADFSWRKLRQTEGIVIDKHLVPYLTKQLPANVIKIALEDFFPEELPEKMDKDLLFNALFIPWLLFNWIPYNDFDSQNFAADKTIAQNYINNYQNRLTSFEQRFIAQMNTTYYSFYSILDVKQEESLLVKDIMLGAVYTIKERQGTRYLRNGDIVFSRVLTLDNQSVFIGMAPYNISPQYHNNIIDFRQWLIACNDDKPLNANLLREEFDEELINFFFEIMAIAFNQPEPTLLNTDDEPIQFSKSYFKLTINPIDALNKLLPLTLSNDADDFLSDSEKNKDGTIKRIEFPWLKQGNKKHKEWDNTVMGHITLEQNRLILETNSDERLAKGKKLVTKYLGDAACFQKTLIESAAQKLQSAKKLQSEKKLTNSTPIEPQLLEAPEVQAQLKEMAKAHWDNWFNEPIPMLGNKTPRQAAKTKAGQEKLEALLVYYDRADQNRAQNNLFKVDTNYLRKELGLLDSK